MYAMHDHCGVLSQPIIAHFGLREMYMGEGRRSRWLTWADRGLGYMGSLEADK